MNDQATALRHLVEASSVRRGTEVSSRPERESESAWSLPSTRRSAKAIASLGRESMSLILRSFSMTTLA